MFIYSLSKDIYAEYFLKLFELIFIKNSPDVLSKYLGRDYRQFKKKKIGDDILK